MKKIALFVSALAVTAVFFAPTAAHAAEPTTPDTATTSPYNGNSTAWD
ncbi:hypothetical protein [Micromonospora sp. 15K316]|nr:hypothetical protein [Micromonospora sp. 15K316]